MADISARESIISANEDDNSIKNSIGDTWNSGTSVYYEDDNMDSANRRFIRQQAKFYLDRVVENKLEDPDLVREESIEEALERISRERQQQREQYKAALETQCKRNKKRNGRKRPSRLPEEAAAVEIMQTEGIETEAETIKNIETQQVETENIQVEKIETENTEVQKIEIENTEIQKAETSNIAIDNAEAQEEPADNRLNLFIDKTVICVQAKLKRTAVITSSIASIILSFINKEISAKVQALGARISPREAIFSAKAAVVVDRVDYSLDKLFIKTSRRFCFFMRKQREAREWCEGHKRQLLGSVAALAVLAGAATIWVGSITAYEYMYNGKVIGIVKDYQDVYKTIDIIGDKLTYAYGAEITIDKEKDISFRKVIGTGLDVDSKEDVLNEFTYLRDMNASAYAIQVDGQTKAILYSKKCAEKILSDIQSTYLVDSESIEYESIGFAEDIEIVEVNTKIGNIQKEEEVLDYMLTGAVQIKTYSVVSGDTFNQIAKNLGLSSEELQQANPGVDPARLQIGDELVLNKVCPVLTVRTTEVAEYTVPIDYEITYEETATLYKGEQAVKSSGVKGERQVVAEIVRHNGEEVTRNELSSQIISEPKSQVVLKGTKDLPPLIGTGKFIYPARGTTLTSRFGQRWGRMHNGIDLAAPTGTKIRAADGGKVISAGWEGALGYCVRIDHGQNKVTVYGHCSKLFVKKGDKVYQDQHIANIGSTGRSTGPHLHFEVHVNGVPKNPLKYLGN